MVNGNAKNIVKQVLSSGDTVGLLAVKDVGGTTRYIADYSAYPAEVEGTFTLTAADAGISVGSGSTTPTESDYQLASPITSGLTGTVAVSKDVDGSGNTSITYSVTLTNTSGSSIDISEIGYKQTIAASDSFKGTTATDRVFLLDRSVFDTITLAAGGQAVIDYKIKAVVTNGGGVEGSKTITQNGTYLAEDDDLDGYSSVTVNVPSSAVLGTKSITENGTYSAQDDNYDGYSEVTVNVSGGTLGTKTITQNGTYNASSDNLDGYSQVTVNVSGGQSPYLVEKGATTLTFELTNEAGGAYADPVTDGIDVYPHVGAWGALVDVTDYDAIYLFFSSVSNAQYARVGIGDTLGYSSAGSNLDVMASLGTGNNLTYRLDVSSYTGDKYLQFEGGNNARAVIRDIIAV